ncbi:hypothetical protein HOLleu_41807 [Holothuria leucospilota]|uniref:Helix-turn-helix domain-containing protein n=1 Tax=Holothuria leucospilota TaxID=206669 RepID=A0A9Q0YEG3_HOLLE|nr:hypothetical protein HOLleu_41807 [Holothuria leucospilota]
MGTPVAPSYANIFMGTIEQDILNLTSHILPNTWKRFIDDIHFLWTLTSRNLSLFQTLINTRHPTIKYTFNSSQDNVQFLDIQITQNNTQLETKIYSKPTDSHAYLLPTSCHPKHTFTSIPYSQALRVIRNCSNTDTTTYHLNELQTHFNNRGYDPSTVSQQINRAKQIPRNELLTYKPRKKNKRILLVVTYSPIFANLPRKLHKCSRHLQNSPELKSTFKEPPMVAFRRPRSLRDLLVRPREPTPLRHDISSSEPPGFFSCKSRKCMLHSYIHATNKFKSTQTNQEFPITTHINCKNSWVIYLMTCTHCGKQYVDLIKPNGRKLVKINIKDIKRRPVSF